MSALEPQSPTDDLAWSRRERGLLVVLAANMLIDAIEVSMAIVVMPSVGRDLGLPLGSFHWILTGFALGFGGLLLFGSRLVTLFGRREVYLVAMAVFAAASVIGGLATGVEMLLATRILKGCCAALTAPTGIAIIATAFAEGPKRGRAMSAYAFAGGCGFAAGLVLAGVLTSAAGWRWTFVLPAPVVLILLLLGLRFIPREPRPDPVALSARGRYGTIAVTGFVVTCLLVGATALVRGIAGAPDRAVFLTVAAVLLAVFVVAESRAARPLVSSRLLRNGVLVRSMLGAAALNGSFLGLLFVATLQLQTVQGWSPLCTAMAILPVSVPLVFTSLFAERMVRRFGTTWLIALGAVPPVAGFAWYLSAVSSPSYLGDVLPVMLLVGAGFVLSFAPLNMQGVSSVPVEQRPMAGALYQTAVQVAAAVVPALVSAMLITDRVGPRAIGAEATTGSRPALGVITAVGAIGLATGLIGLVAARRRANRSFTDEAHGDAITAGSRDTGRRHQMSDHHGVDGD